MIDEGLIDLTSWIESESYLLAAQKKIHIRITQLEILWLILAEHSLSVYGVAGRVVQRSVVFLYTCTTHSCIAVYSYTMLSLR